MRKNMRKNVKYANMRIKALYAQKTYLLDFDIPTHPIPHFGGMYVCMYVFLFSWFNIYTYHQ